MIRYQTIAKFSAESGYSEDAINSKIRDGVWLEGQVWKKAPDGRRLIDLEGFSQWVEMEQASPQSVKRASKSPLPISANAAANVSSSPRPLRI